MRQGIVCGNGASCDKCGKMLYPKEVIKVKSFELDCSIDNTGRYKQVDKADVCEDCYEELKKWFT